MDTRSPGVLRYFHPVLPARNLGSRPKRVDVAGRRYVLFRDNRGVAAALDDLCPHRRAPLSKGTVSTEGRITCPYHGWNFDASGLGRSPSTPDLKRCRTGAYRLVEHFGFLWLAERDANSTFLPAFDWPSFSYAGHISTRFPASMELTLDNVTEDEHFAFVHSTFGWNESRAAEVQLETGHDADHTWMSLQGPQRRSPWAGLGGLKAGDTFHNRWVTRFDPVATTYTFGWRDPATGKDRPITTRAVVYLVPENERSTWAHMFIFSQIRPSIFQRVPWLVHWTARTIASRELKRDAAVIRHVADVPADIAGMRLTRWDKALARNRKLLAELYWSHPTDPSQPQPQSEATSRRLSTAQASQSPLANKTLRRAQ